MNEDKIIKFYKLASVQAELFSKDPSKKVCALFIAPESHQILSAGYNGLPRKIKETEERWDKPKKYNYIVHAEKNINQSLDGTNYINTGDRPAYGRPSICGECTLTLL